MLPIIQFTQMQHLLPSLSVVQVRKWEGLKNEGNPFWIKWFRKAPPQVQWKFIDPGKLKQIQKGEVYSYIAYCRSIRCTVWPFISVVDGYRSSTERTMGTDVSEAETNDESK